MRQDGGVALSRGEAQAALKAVAWFLTRRPDALLDPEAGALLQAQRKLAEFLEGGGARSASPS